MVRHAGVTGGLVQVMSWLVTVAAVLLYLLVNTSIIVLQLRSVGERSEHAKLLSIARMLLNYMAVLSGLGNFKSESLRLLQHYFGSFFRVAQSGGLVGMWVMDCATGWSFAEKYMFNMVSAPLLWCMFMLLVSAWLR
jgi:uncharacterized membrane-anchored protein YitT (DUF2179 family)